MAKRFKQIPVLSLVGSPVSVWYDRRYLEYQARIAGEPSATYHTDDREDAISTAQHMRNNLGDKHGT